jgi:hypothetical protein
VWGSAAGALFSWEPFDFGLRQAAVAGAEAAVTACKARRQRFTTGALATQRLAPIPSARCFSRIEVAIVPQDLDQRLWSGQDRFTRSAIALRPCSRRIAPMAPM